MSNLSNVFDFAGEDLATFLAKVVSDGTYDDVLDELKTDRPGFEAPASSISTASGQLWSNMVDDFIESAYPLLRSADLGEYTQNWNQTLAVSPKTLGQEPVISEPDRMWIGGQSSSPIMGKVFNSYMTGRSESFLGSGVGALVPIGPPLHTHVPVESVSDIVQIRVSGCISHGDRAPANLGWFLIEETWIVSAGPVAVTRQLGNASFAPATPYRIELGLIGPDLFLFVDDGAIPNEPISVTSQSQIDTCRGETPP